MNIEAKPGSELATRSSYENFVIELAEGMKVDENVFLPKKEGEFDYEDIFSWIRAVDFRNGKPPKIERTIKEDRGIKTLELKTQELDEITDENKKLSSESQLYAMAVTEAKMAVVAELAEDTYPAVRYQINEIRREMQKVRQEIFGVEDKEKSVKEILDRMVRSKKIQAATALVIAAMILTACSNPTQINASEIVNPTRPVATEVSPTPATPTAEQAVLEPTPTVEITQTVEEEGRVEIVRNINEFLLGDEGRYSDASLSDEIFIYGKGSWLETQGLIENDLGLFEVNDEFARVQGFNLGFVQGENCVWMFFGTKLGDEGKKVVLPIKIPLESIKYRIPIFFNYLDRLDLHNDFAAPTMLKQDKLTTFEEIVDEGNKLIDEPIMLDLWYNYKGNTAEDLRGVVGERGGSDDDFEKVLGLYTEMYGLHKKSFCSFHPIQKDINDNPGCGSGYSGVVIDSAVNTIDENWFKNEDNIMTTILTTYVDNDN